MTVLGNETPKAPQWGAGPGRSSAIPARTDSSFAIHNLNPIIWKLQWGPALVRLRDVSTVTQAPGQGLLHGPSAPVLGMGPAPVLKESKAG